MPTGRRRVSDAPFPTDGVEMTQLLVISDLERARTFYRDVLGATVVREYGGTSCVLQFQGSWLLLVTGGDPTKDKPTRRLGWGDPLFLPRPRWPFTRNQRGVLNRTSVNPRRRNTCAALALLGLVACQEAAPDWEAFAVAQYVDTTVGDGGQDEHGWTMVEGRRAEGSLVLDTAHVLADPLRESVHRAVQDVADSAGIGPVIGEGLLAALRVWRTASGILVTVSASNPSARTETADVFDDQLGRLVTVPAYRNYI
jgi:catechol 2,3-dioxygenase-like lactoylglutathione lyase family enzyme